jgi:hypothetical protein
MPALPKEGLNGTRPPFGDLYSICDDLFFVSLYFRAMSELGKNETTF